MLSPSTFLLPFVERLAVHSRITPQEEAALLALPGRLETYGSHREIVGLHQRVTSACLVVEGLVGRFGQVRDGTRQITALYIDGDMPDLHSVVMPRAASALVALSPTTCLRVSHAAFRALLSDHPAVGEMLWRACTIDAGVATAWMLNLGRLDANTKVAHLFCEMATRYAAIGRGEDDSFTFPINQFDLGEATGITAIHANRTLRSLREKGLLLVRGAEVTILDRKNLFRAGAFDPAYLMLEGPPDRVMPAAA